MRLQAQRAEILSAAIRGKTTITGGSPDTLDLEAVARETEGCWPQDLKVLLERAVHANALHARVGTASGMKGDGPARPSREPQQ